MFDVNDHPQQELLNKHIGFALSHTVQDLSRISRQFNVDAIQLADQFKDSLDMFIEKYVNSSK